MAVMTVELVEIEWAGDVPCDERCMWREAAEDVAHTVDGFCEFRGATGHPSP